MKRGFNGLLCEIATALFLGTGAVVLVATDLPIINPRLYEYVADEQGRIHHVTIREQGENPRSLGGYLVGTCVGLAALAAAWRFNLKALRFKGEIPWQEKKE